MAEGVPTGLSPHDHAACRADGLSRVEAICEDRGLRLTKARRRTLEILLESHVALGAYEVLERLAAEGLGAQPPVVYRALNFLVDNGFAHKIEGRNGFVACVSPGAEHDPAFLICRACGRVGEATIATRELDRSADLSDFAVERTVVEAEGVCARCRKEP
ncbi:Fur family transcriptional regulator [Roseobacter sp. HKCCA0434]|uniref:Fur family transcriptional regulator n=1 Tax=Roseobacter sp. HKCCA0434 TaxID=3079297 RepID=UPI002905C9F7|nr:Fur family transcriptional regulator [Roseobacter sp. HKCCA0434]